MSLSKYSRSRTGYFWSTKITCASRSQPSIISFATQKIFGAHMPNYSKFREKDIDGRWFEFDHQQMGNSCGPASVKNIKMLVNNVIVGEGALRGIGTMHTFQVQNTGESPLS